MRQKGVDPAGVQSIVDLGCATGLSSRALLDAFPGAAVTGVDLSPYFLAVGRFEQREREASDPGWGRGERHRRWARYAASLRGGPAADLPPGRTAMAANGRLGPAGMPRCLQPAAWWLHAVPHHRPPRLPAARPARLQAASGSGERLSFVHAAAEDTGLPAGTADLVSMCLVAHELPQSATRAILREAYRRAARAGRMCGRTRLRGLRRARLWHQASTARSASG